MLTVLSNDSGMHFVYILASRPGGALYLGETNDLARRVEQHRSGSGSVHTAKYKNHALVWFRIFEDRREAKDCERRIKKWHRKWKVAMITETNLNWKDLSPTLADL